MDGACCFKDGTGNVPATFFDSDSEGLDFAEFELPARRMLRADCRVRRICPRQGFVRQGRGTYDDPIASHSDDFNL